MSSRPNRKDLENQIQQLKAENIFLNNQYRHLVENSMDAIILTEPDGKIFFANQAACVLFGMTDQELLQGGQRSVIVQDGKRLEKAFDSIEQTGQFMGELIFKKKEGTCFPAEVSASVFKKGEEKKLLSVIIKDITCRKQAERKLRDSEIRYRSLFENMGSGVIIFEVKNKDLIVKDINPAGERITRTSRLAAIGKRPSELWRSDREFGLYHYVTQVLETGKPFFFKTSIFRDCESTAWVEIQLYPLPGREIVSIFNDVTQRETARQALEESEAKFRTDIETVNDGLALFSADGKILTWNKGAERITEIKTADIIGKTTEHSYINAVHEDGSPCRPDDIPSTRTIRTGRPVTNKILGIRLHSGKTRWILINTIPLRRMNSLKPYQMCLSFSDITSLKKNKEALESLVRRRSARLQDTNSALKILIEKREQDLYNIEKKLIANCDTLLTPLLARLKMGIEDLYQKQLVNVIQENLMAVLSPFSKTLAAPQRRLTPSEIQISAMITQGLSNKEIAQILNISVRTVTNHRDNIRTKLKLKNKKVNLRSYLMLIK